MGKSSKTPAAPDYTGLAKQQGDLSKAAWTEQTQTNRPNQSNQFGKSEWTQDPTTGQWTQSTTLNDDQQNIFDSQQRNQQDIADKGGEMLADFNPDYSGIPKMGEVGGFNQQATDLFNQLAQPGLDRQVNGQRARAAAMGIPEFGSRAGDSMNQQLGDLVSRSGMMGAQKGIDQGNIMFDQQNKLHNQGYTDINNQVRDMQGLFGLGKDMGTPQFAPVPQAGAYQIPDLLGAASKGYDASLNTTNAKNADTANRNSTLGSIATTAAIVF